MYQGYEQTCHNMAFDLGFSLTEIEGIVYEDSTGELSPVCIPTGDRSLWFETWLELKNRIAQSDFRFKKYK